MLQARHRKILWLLLLFWMLALHGWLYHEWLPDSPLWYGFAEGFARQLPLVWAGGALCMALWQLLSYQRFRRKAVEGIKAVEESWMRSACAQAASEAGLENAPPLYLSSQISTPLVMGFTAPVMLVPELPYTWAELRMVFLHECTHVRKRDLWYKLIFTAGTCMLWFQPLLYLLKAAAYRDLEVACDQSVVEGKSEAERKAYADFLLQSLRRGRAGKLPHSAYFYNSKAVMKARLSVVEDMRVHSGLPGTVVCLSLVLLTAWLPAERLGGAGRELWKQSGPGQNMSGQSSSEQNMSGQNIAAQEPSVQAGVSGEERPQSACRARTLDGVTEVTWNDGQDWLEVPVPLEKLTARGDQMEGALTGVQERSYVVAEEMAAFAYGGSGEVPVTVTWTKDRGENWTTSVVTYAYTSVRRLFVSFPDTEHGFLVLTVDRTMWQEADVLFRTEDGGYTWTEVERETAPGSQGGHSLTMEAVFITPEVGYLAAGSAPDPVLYRTKDGGVNWELCEFSELEEVQEP